jgi:polyisoprenoid-binding protein YceI
MRFWRKKVSVTAAPSPTTSWTVDNAHTTVGFKVTHLVISSVNGRFNKFSGTAEFDEKAGVLTSVKAVIDANSIDTNEPDRDAHLRKGDFFDVEHHPNITFEAARIDFKSGKFKGKLTIRGVTKEVDFKVEGGKTATDPWGNRHLAFSFKGEINRNDFGVSWNKTLDKGGVVVGNTVAISIEGEALQKKLLAE